MPPKRNHLSLKSLVFSLISVLGLWSSVLSAQIHKDSTLIIGWTSNVSVQRGYINISDTTATDQGSNRASVGEPNNATGPADGNIVSLGDGGIATYSLDSPIGDGPGPDFAVFENGFREIMPPNLWFLELAVVEVSSDGQNYIRFPAVSNTQTNTQTGTFGQLDPELLHNLAGKYPVLHGTPFDLSDLLDSTRLDIQAITHIRIIDVVGSVDSDYGTRDSNGNKINDPWPTPFWSGGFDLDAVAILGASTGMEEVFEWRMWNAEWRMGNGEWGIKVFPNPVSIGETINIQFTGLENLNNLKISIIDQTGRIISSSFCNLHSAISILHSPLPIPHSPIQNPGIYFVVVQTPESKLVQQLIVQ